MLEYHPHQRRVLAVFPDRPGADRAARTARELRAAKAVRVDNQDDRLDAFMELQHRESEESMPAVSVGVMTGGLARGALVWGLGGALVGAVIGAALSLLVNVDSVPRWVLAVTFAFAGALAVASAAFVYGGGRRSEVEGETRTTAGDVVVAVEVGEQDLEQDDEVRRTMVGAGAVEVITLDHAVPRRPASEVERPEAAGPPTGPASGHLMDD